MLKKLEQDDVLTSVLSNPYVVDAEECRRDFFTFVQVFWDTIITEEPIYNWHIEYLCKEAQRMAHRVLQGKPKKYDLLVNIPPGTTKTVILSIMLPAWVWIARIPGKPGKTGAFVRFLTGAYKADISQEAAEYSRDVIQSPKYRKYFPELEIRKDKNAKNNYMNTAGGYRSTTSVGTAPTGKHAHIIIIDDPVDPEQALSDADRETANRWVGGVMSTRKVNKAVTVTIMIMQRLHKDDPSGSWLTQKAKGLKIKHIVLPGALEYRGFKYDIKPKKLKKYYTNGLLDPVRFGISALKELYIRLLGYGFSAQIGQDPRDREGGMFQRQFIEIVDAAPAGGTVWVRGWDLAATSESEAKKKKLAPAYTAGVKMKYCDGIFYIGHVARERVSNPRFIMKNTASQDESGTIIDFPQDPGSAGKVQAKSLASHLMGYNVKSGLESGDKILRLEPFSAQWEAGNVKLVRGKWNDDYLDEGEYFPNGFKDQYDASGRAFNRLVNIIAQSNKGRVGAPAGVKNTRNMNPDTHKR